jgi:hypothetical protein
MSLFDKPISCLCRFVFYCYAHGSGTGIGNYSHSISFDSYGIGDLLGNHYNTKGGLITKYPYRFVFLDGCSTASQKNWRRAFGIFPLDAPNQARLNKVGPQAFVGWAKEHAGNYVTADLAEAYTETLNDFYGDWMNRLPLAECIQNASDPKLHNCPFPVPGNEVVKDIDGNPFKGETSKIYISGHTGLTRDSVNAAWENYKPYAPPPGNE